MNNSNVDNVLIDASEVVVGAHHFSSVKDELTYVKDFLEQLRESSFPSKLDWTEIGDLCSNYDVGFTSTEYTLIKLKSKILQSLEKLIPIKVSKNSYNRKLPLNYNEIPGFTFGVPVDGFKFARYAMHQQLPSSLTHFKCFDCPSTTDFHHVGSDVFRHEYSNGDPAILTFLQKSNFKPKNENYSLIMKWQLFVTNESNSTINVDMTFATDTYNSGVLANFVLTTVAGTVKYLNIKITCVRNFALNEIVFLAQYETAADSGSYTAIVPLSGEFLSASCTVDPNGFNRVYTGPETYVQYLPY